jgi:hypothetical protein
MHEGKEDELVKGRVSIVVDHLNLILSYDPCQNWWSSSMESVRGYLKLS